MNAKTVGNYILVFVAMWLLVTGIGSKDELSDMREIVYGTCINSSGSNSHVFCNCVADQSVKGMFFEALESRVFLGQVRSPEDVGEEVLANSAEASSWCARR